MKPYKEELYPKLSCSNAYTEGKYTMVNNSDWLYHNSSCYSLCVSRANKCWQFVEQGLCMIQNVLLVIDKYETTDFFLPHLACSEFPKKIIVYDKAILCNIDKHRSEATSASCVLWKDLVPSHTLYPGSLLKQLVAPTDFP